MAIPPPNTDLGFAICIGRCIHKHTTRRLESASTNAHTLIQIERDTHRTLINFVSSMFVLNPGGSGGSSGSGSSNNKVLWYFTQLGLYFVTLRGVYLFFNARENNSRALEQK